MDMWGLTELGGVRRVLKSTATVDAEGVRLSVGKGEKALLSIVESVASRDALTAALMGSDHMPGSVTEAVPYDDSRVRSLPISSSRYNLMLRSTALSSTNSLQSHVKSPMISSKSTSKFDDHASSPHDDLDKKSVPPRGKMTWLAAKQLAASMSLVDDLCALDKVVSFHLFLASYDSSDGLNDWKMETQEESEKTKKNTKQFERKKLTPQVLKSIFDGIASNLPNVDTKRVTPLKCIYVISNHSRSEISPSFSHSQVHFGVLIVELVQKEDLFLHFKISKITKGCGHLTALVKIVVKSFFLTLKACGIRAIKVKNDLSLSFLGRTVSTFQRKMVDACMSTATSKSILNCRKHSNLMLLMRELVQSKIHLGFQVPKGITGIEKAEDEGRASHNFEPDPALVVHLCAVSPRSPSGIEMESLLQCKYTLHALPCTLYDINAN